ncbi:MAG: lipoprotein insertase outer membrane protein LolB [Xanthomonadaceae bacterium]|jgi:outer membrane lipoprotein LolB|nr:lipoprotein insertase outer membrane protein LolB [Xanthomonadaceae bacterium]
MKYRLALAASLSLLMAGCLPTRPSPPPVTVVEAGDLSPETRQAEAERGQWLRTHPGWSFQGRAAISSGRQGGNARIDWRQWDDRNYMVELIAPVTRQTWRLTGNAHDGSGRLEGMPGGPRDGELAVVLLRQATGWDIPLELLPDWVRGMMAAAAQPGRVGYDAEGRPYRIRQMGWAVEFQEWYPAAGDRPALPRRLEARNEFIDAKVRLLIDQWNFQAVDSVSDERE